MTGLFDLTGRTAVVTGAKRGIGLAMAEALAAAGADVVGVSATLSAEESEVRTRVEAHGRRFHGCAVDFADRGAVASFAESVAAEHGPIDILVNNAGTIRRAPAATHALDDWDHVLEVNLHEHFVDPCIVENGAYRLPSQPGYSAQMHAASVAEYTYPDGPRWSARLQESREMASLSS